MITTNTTHTGAITCTALVTDKDTPFSYYHTLTFYGYDKKEARQLFKQALANAGQKIVKD